MNFTILRRLQHSELGMFHAYRKLGKEGSKQRAINFDWDVVDRVFPSAKDSDKILIDCRFQKDATTVTTAHQWLKRQDKNWRFEGNCPKSEYYNFVEPGCLFAMNVDAGVTPAISSWVVIPESHKSYQSIIDHAESGGLASAGMIALFGEECTHVREVLANYYPALFENGNHLTASSASTGMEPHPLGTFTILANAGHILPSAVADLVDNSISAGATEITITFPNPNIGGRWMCVRDNGHGMSPETLREAMRIGNPRSYESRDLGRYGFGLKGASWSQADTLTVLTSLNGQQSHLTWDKAHLQQTGRWVTLQSPIPEQYVSAVAITGVSGTSVLMTNMRPPAVMANVRDVDPYTVEIAELRDHLGLVFHRFINGIAKGRSKVTIAINGDSVRPNNPVEHPLTRPHDQRQIQCQINDETSTTILLQAFVLPTEAQIRQQHTPDGELVVREEMNRLSLGGRMNASQGLYFYRLDRLIKWGGWCDVYTEDEHTKLLRVTVDFDRAADDLMKVNISKREVQLSVKLREALKNAVKDGRADARSRYSGKVPKSMGPSTNGDASTTTQTNVDKGKISKPNDQSNGSTGESRRPTGEPSNQVKIRIVASKQRWQQSKGFLGETTMEVSEEIVSLVSLTKAIENNTEAKKALIEFLAYLDGQSNA